MHTQKNAQPNTVAISSPSDLFQQAFQLHQQGQLEQAEALYEALLKTEPQHIDALHFSGVLANQLGQAQRAVDLISQSLAINANNAAAHSNLGLALHELKRFEAAIASYDRALAINPNHADAHFNRGHALRELKRFPEAIACYEQALAIKPNLDFILGTWLYLKMNLCAWDGFTEHLNALTQGIEQGEKMVIPFSLLAMSSSLALQKRAAEIYTASKHPSAPRLPLPAKHTHAKIKIGYFSSDFRQHPVSYLTAELFERHDRSRFEIIAFSFHAADVKDAMRLRLEAAFDQFYDVSQQSDQQIVDLARQLEIDIAIDLNGCTDRCRTDIFALRAAPVQVNYLGYLGTMGADYIDYLLADSTLIPTEHQTGYSEKIAYLPHSFQVNDSTLAIADRVFTRTELGLPEQGFVFCCFNNQYKITPAVFDSWMRILHQVDGSVLWLLGANADMEHNLRHAALGKGIATNRLVFANRVPMPEYLAHHRCADLFLDTQPYNAGATASAALWADLPVLTCLGDTLSGRMGASLLHAIGLPELITRNPEEYEALAIQLAAHPEQLSALKHTLAANRLNYPLFDTRLFTQHIESAFQAMFDRYQADLAPEHIYVQAQDTPPVDANAFAQALSLHQQGQLAAAETLYTAILHAQPQHSDALHFFGVLKNQQGQALRAVELITRALDINPDNAAAHSNLGLALHALKRFADAIASYDRALAIKPNAEAYYNRGNSLLALDRFDAALASYDGALSVKPDYLEALSNRGIVLRNLNRFDEALGNYQRILTIKPDSAEAEHGCGVILQDLKRFDEAIVHYDRALTLKPDLAFILGTRLYLKRMICDWRDMQSYLAELMSSIARGEQAAIPFSVLAMTDSLAVQKKAAEIYTETQHPSTSLLPPIAKYSHKKIRLGYFSADFHRHATAYLMAELFERHDKERFELIAFSFGTVNDKNEMRLRLEAGFDQFHEVSQQSDEDIARLARQLEIDIAIDLKGFTQDYRATIFALRTAPIQVSYLGYPSTMGADYMDYIIADSVLIPEAYQPYYTEKVVYLPDSYQVNDSTRDIADKAFTRAELGLPEQGFVFCCFNNNYKITPEVFDSWMRIMRRIDGSVLWLLEDNNSVVKNLRREAQARGIAAERLIFAARMPLPEHLARHRLADLFLDTLPYNAHTTTSDALWAGLPVLTCMGEAFAARVAASLLTAVGLPELITSTTEDYEALAIQLATHPEQLAALKQKLAAQRLSCPLFDTARFTRHIESAYQIMYDRYQADLAPDHIYVTAQSDSVTPVIHAESLQRAHALHLSALLATQRGDWQQAVELLNQSLAINPDNAAAYLDLGSAFQELHNFNQALASYDRALALKPDYVEAFYNRGNLFLDDQQFDKAVLSYDSALHLKPHDANTLHNRGIALKNLHRYDEAVASYGQALAINPDTQFLFGDWLYLKMSVCNWDNLDQHLDELEQGIQQGKPLSVPFTVLAFSDSIALQKQVAVSYAAEKYPSAQLLPLPPKHAHKKIKIGYFSADFYHHATAYLMAELFERHDKTRFDIVAFSFSPVNHQDALRLRLENAFDRFIDVSQQSDEQVVRLARQLEIDIAIDLKGYTEHSRPNIFAMRAAPIQVNYLGYPSTMGAAYMDYLLADSVLIPDQYQAYYSEKIAYLPHSYQVNDAKRAIANKTFTRAELGLPAHGIVFCCFNSNYKITPAVFDSWMRILHEVDGSVLWLLEDNGSAANNLRKEASAGGIDSKRLCFAKRMTLAEHLARHRVADLFLDTSPCNAHTTASDALWAGLPVLTCIGDTFAGRVAASLLTAIGLPELITDTLEDYEALAIQLATHPKQLAALKQKLATNRLRYPLFDTPLFTQHIESAYQLMFNRYQADLTPEHIYVPAQAVSKQPPPEVNNTKAKQPPEPAKSSGLFAKLLTGITRRKDKSAENQQADESFTQAEANMFERAQRLHQQGQHAAADILYEQLLKTQPHHAELLRCSAALKKLHPQPLIPAPAPPQPALSNTEQLLAHFNQGLEYQDANRLSDALNSYERVLAIDPNHVDALINRGNVLEDLNRLTDALASYDRAIAARPDYARAYSNRGNVLQSLQRFDEALISYDRALAIQPDYAVAFYNRGNTLQACKRPRDAIQSYQYALAIKPDFIQAVISLGNALHDDQRFDDALSSYDRALIIQPDHAEALYNRGNVLHDLNRYSDAIDSYNRALAIKPDDAGARWNSSFCYLILGDFANGWKNYEARWQTDDFIKAARHFTAPQWSGDEPLQGKTILLYGEQGLGDTLHFCRYAKQVAALGGRVILEVQKPLLPLLAQLEGVEQVIAQGEPLPSFDFHSPLLSLPLAFNTRLDSIPAAVPYLFSNPDKVQHWQAILGAKTLPRVGVVWSGNAAHKNDHNRSLALSELLPLLTLDCQFISLQKELRDTDTALLTQLARLRHYGTQLHDFTDTAALIELMDVVISVDTSVAHLSAAMGKPTWILLADNQDWRWLLKRADSPWYPSARLFRQPAPRDWQTVLDNVYAQLNTVFAANTGNPPVAERDGAETAPDTFQHAMRLHQQGQLAAAEALYKDILRIQPQHIDALHFLGVLKNQQGQTQRAVELISQSLALYPDNAAAHCNLALALQSLQRLDDAVACYDKVLALQPNTINALSGRGIVLQMLNRFAEALLDYDRILAIDPHHAEALFGRANVLYKLKRLDDALISYQSSLALNPDSVEALYNQGLLLVELNRIDDAISNYQRALAIKPDYAEVHNNLGSLLSKQERYTEAASSYQRAIASKPDYMEAYCNLITLLKDQGRTIDAQATINAALAALPDSLELRFIQLIMSLPMVTHTVTEAALVATHFDTALTDLENWLMQSPSHQHSLANADLLPLPFLLAYRTGNHVQRLSRYGDIVAVQGNAVAVAKTRTKLKMVVVSHHFHRHSVWDVITRGLLVNIDRSRFELVLYHLGGLEDQETAFAKSLADGWRDTQTVSDVHGWLSVLADDKPDVIFYPEIGMDPMSARLAAHRLAPLQITSWGHPVTTGLPAIDLYFSGDLLESAEADKHYRERLIRLPSTGCCTTLFKVTPEPLPELAAQLATRQGISFIIPQTVYKFDPADDGLYADIASVVGNCTFILLRGRDNAWAMDQVVARLEQTFIDRGLPPEQHLLIIPWQSVEKFQTLLDLCDVYLDCPSFSGYTTAWQAAHRGIPIVTLEGEFMRQRLAAGLLRKIGITDTIASSRADYVRIAVKLAEECRNPIVRNARRQLLKTAAPKADNDSSVVRAFEQTVLEAVAKKGS